MPDDVLSRVPPQDLDAEAAVLSACMNDRAAFDSIADMLLPEHFYSEAHRRIFEAIVAIAIDGTRPDIVLVASWLRDHERLNQVGGMPYLTAVINAAPGLSNTKVYAETVFGHWRVRQLLLTCKRVDAQGYGGLGEHGGPSKFIENVAEQVFQLAITDTRMGVGSVRETMRDVFTAINRASHNGNITGLATGFERFDRLTSGLHNGELTIVAARPGMGKTSLVLNMASNVAGKPILEEDPKAPKYEGWTSGVLFFSLEMQREQLVQRMLSSEARVEGSRLRSNTRGLTSVDWAKLTEAAGKLSSRCIRIDDQSGLTLTQLRAKLRRTEAEEIKNKVKIVLVVVDYLQLMSGRGDEGSREQEISGLSRGLKVLAKDMRIPVIALSQLNRAVESRTKEKRPQLSDLRESGAIEQDADNVHFIYRDDYYDKESPDRNLAEIITAKQRNGPTSTVKVRWDGQYTRFDDLPDGEGEDYQG